MLLVPAEFIFRYRPLLLPLLLDSHDLVDLNVIVRIVSRHVTSYFIQSLAFVKEKLVENFCVKLKSVK
jgi:hypothetical protein